MVAFGHDDFRKSAATDRVQEAARQCDGKGRIPQAGILGDVGHVLQKLGIVGQRHLRHITGALRGNVTVSGTLQLSACARGLLSMCPSGRT
jgi:hypothetical protein